MGLTAASKSQIVFLEDRDYRPSERIIKSYLTPGALVPLPASGLLNHVGLPNGGLDIDLDGQEAERTLDVSAADFASFELQHGETSVFHLINAGSVVPFIVSIDEHKIQVIGADGTEVQRGEELDEIFVDIGQRYTVAVVGDRDPDKTYWMRAVSLQT